MKAVVHTEYGPPDELELQEVEMPVPKENEVLIRIHATTVTTSDCNIRNLTFVPRLFHLPMRLEFGLTKPKNKILGFDLQSQAEAIKPHVGYMAQQFSLYGELSVLENLGFFAELFNVTKQEQDDRTQGLLEFAGLTEFTERWAVHLSGGMPDIMALKSA